MNRINPISSVWSLIFLVPLACSEGTPLELAQPNPETPSNDTPDAGTVSRPLDSGVVSVPIDAGTSDETPDAGGPPVDAGVEPEPNPDRTDYHVLDLGSVMFNADGESGPLTFTMPSDVVTFMVVLTGPSDATLVVKKLSGPTGLLVDDDPSNVSIIDELFLGPFAAQFKSPNRVIQDLEAAGFLFPNNPDVQVGGGEYTLELAGLVIQGQQGVPYTGSVDVQIYYRTESSVSSYLDVHLHFTGAAGITAASAPTDPLIQGALEEMGAIYSQAGLSLGNVSYYDTDPAYRTIEVSLTEGIGGLEELFRLSAGKDPGLHFFFIDRFEGGLPGTTVAGVSGGLPGPPLMRGTGSSGVAVAFAPADGDPKVLAHVMAHEGGHWLGLFHTSEITGTEDQMPDTPSGQAADTFLMYPAVGGGTTISPSQGTVLRHHIETVRD